MIDDHIRDDASAVDVEVLSVMTADDGALYALVREERFALVSIDAALAARLTNRTAVMLAERPNE